MNNIKVLFVGWEPYPKENSIDKELRPFAPKYYPIVVNGAAEAFHEIAKSNYSDPSGNMIRAIVFSREFVVNNKGIPSLIVEFAKKYSIHLKAISFIIHTRDSKGKRLAPTELIVKDKEWEQLKTLLDAQKLFI